MTVWALAAFALLLTYAAIGDVRRYQIPNWLCAVVAAAGIVLVFPGPDGGEWLSRGASVGTVAVVGFALWWFRLFGGGDYKLLVAAAFWMPFGGLVDFVILLALAGGVQAFLTLTWRRFGKSRADSRSGQMPYGVSIAVAGIGWGLMQVAL